MNKYMLIFDPIEAQHGVLSFSGPARFSESCAVPSSVDRSANSAPESGDFSQPQFPSVSGVLHPALPQGVLHQANPYLPESIPPAPVYPCSPTDPLATHQQFPPGYAPPPGPPSPDDGEAVTASIPVTAPLSTSARALN